MSQVFLRLCRCCWRTMQSATIEDMRYICASCTDIKWYRWRDIVKDWHIEDARSDRYDFEDEIHILLWTMFPQCEIIENTTVHNVYLGDSSNAAYPIFDYVIPEYRLAIDFESTSNTLPFDSVPPKMSAEHQDRFTRIAFDYIKDVGTRDSNYRHITLPTNIVTARDELLRKINEIYVLDTNTGPTILNPKLQGDAGFDIVVSEDVVCPPQSGTDIASDLYIEMPNHLYALVHARSSANKQRLLVLSGVIDPGYRGRIFTMVQNLTNEPIKVNKGDRVSQLLFLPRATHAHISKVDELRESERGAAGFGSTS